MAARSTLQAQMTVGERYRLVRRIGADDHAETWEAFDARLDRPVAVRLLADASRADVSARDALRGAARGPSLPGTADTAPRVLDGGEDPTYGPFVVAELNAAFDTTHPLPTIVSPGESVSGEPAAPLLGDAGSGEPAAPLLGDAGSGEPAAPLLGDAGSGEPAAPRRQSPLRSAARSFPRRPPADPDASAHPAPRSALAGAPDTLDTPDSAHPTGRTGPTAAPRATSASATPASGASDALDDVVAPRGHGSPGVAGGSGTTGAAAASGGPGLSGARGASGAGNVRRADGLGGRGRGPRRGVGGRPMAGPLALALVLLLVCGVVGAAFAARAALSGKTTPEGSTSTRAEATAATAGAAPTPAVAARPTSAPTPQPAAAPAETIRQHYALIAARRYSDGYALMDARLRAQFSPATYASWFAQKVTIQPTAIDTISQTAQQAVVRATVLSTDTVKGRNVTSQVTEEFVLIPENGAWHIDSVTRLDDRPAPRGHDEPARQNDRGDHDDEGDD